MNTIKTTIEDRIKELEKLKLTVEQTIADYKNSIISTNNINIKIGEAIYIKGQDLPALIYEVRLQDKVNYGNDLLQITEVEILVESFSSGRKIIKLNEIIPINTSTQLLFKS